MLIGFSVQNHSGDLKQTKVGQVRPWQTKTESGAAKQALQGYQICHWEVTKVSQKVSPKRIFLKYVPKNCPKISVPKKCKKVSQSVPASQVQPLWYLRCYCHLRWFLFFSWYSLNEIIWASHNLALCCKLIQLLFCIFCISNTGSRPLLFAKLFLHSFSVCVVMKLLQLKL